MWQLSQMSHHQTSALLVTPVFIIHPMIIIMLITKCQYPPIPSYQERKRIKPGLKDAFQPPLYHLRILPVGRDSMVPRVIFKAKSDLQPRFLLSILHLSNIVWNWLAFSKVSVSTHFVKITRSRNYYPDLNIMEYVCWVWWCYFLSFCPRLRNGSPLSRDNFLASLTLTLQL